MNRPLDPHEIAAAADWPEQNFAVLRLGLDWLGTRLADAPSAPPSAATRAALQAYEGARASLSRTPRCSQLDRLSAVFGLAPFDEDVLLLALAPRLDPAFARLYEQAIGRIGATAPTPQLALKLFNGDAGGPVAHARLSPFAPLRRYALIISADPGFAPSAPLGLDERVARYLLGDLSIDQRLQGLLSDALPGSLPERSRPLVAEVADRIANAPRPIAVLTGPRRSGRRAAARAVAAHLGLALVELKARLLPPEGEARHMLMPILAREAALAGLAFLIDADPSETHEEGDARLARLAAQDLLHGVDAVVIAIAEQRLDGPPGVVRARLSALDASDRAALWAAVLPQAAEPGSAAIARVAEHFHFGPEEIGAVAAELDGVDDHALWSACREAASAGLEKLAERVAPQVGWDDLVLPAHLVADLRSIAAQVRHRSAVYGRGAFARKLPRGRGVTALFAGPSGVGKTMAAEVIAHDLDLDLYRIDLSSVISKYIGDTEKNLKRVFDAAETSGAILFFDEADALFGKRSEVKDSHDRYANIEVSYLLQRMETYGGLAILATNLKAHLDPAFLRRLRFVIDIPFPDAAQRRAIWAKAFPQETATEGLDLDALGRLEIAGGNIMVIAVNAAFLAADEGRPVGMAHIARAARAELRKLDKMLDASWAAGPGTGGYR